jgi:hypothetical protein
LKFSFSSYWNNGEKINVFSYTILVNKNWPCDPLGVLKTSNLTIACEAKIKLDKQLDVEFEDEMKCEGF